MSNLFVLLSDFDSSPGKTDISPPENVTLKWRHLKATIIRLGTRAQALVSVQGHWAGFELHPQLPLGV